MTNWIRKIDLTPEWQDAKDGKISIAQMASVVAARLKSIAPYQDANLEYDREELIERFVEIAEVADDYPDMDDEFKYDFEDAMNDLYNFGDIKLDPGDPFNGRGVLWINTF